MAISFIKPFNKMPVVYRMNYKDNNIIENLSLNLAELILSLDNPLTRPIVIVNIGTDRSTGDSLGPLVGNILLSKNICYKNGFAVYGCLEEPVHAVNLKEKLNEISNKFYNPLIIGVDACLGKSDSIGFITLKKGPLKPGTGVKKELPEVGQLHLTGIVNISGYLEYFVLQNTRLNIVMNMANVIGSIIPKSIDLLSAYSKSNIT
jgi:putative sporulation protein YyaC